MRLHSGLGLIPSSPHRRAQMPWGRWRWGPWGSGSSSAPGTTSCPRGGHQALPKPRSWAAGLGRELTEERPSCSGHGESPCPQ